MSYLNNSLYPVILNDGRTFTDYTQNSIKNEKIKKQYGINNNQSYREFLIKHAEIIMKRNYNEMTELNNTPLFLQNNNNKSPYLFDDINDDSKPKGYSESELKNNFLNKEKTIYMNKRQFI
jgi:hypothetical protein